MKKILIIVVSIFIFCGDNNSIEECTTISDPNKAIELIYPRGGETFTVGNSVNVRWKVRSSIVEMVMLQVSTGGINGPWRNILSRGMVVPDSEEIVCMDTIWTIGNEHDKENINYSSGTTVYLRVGWYNHESEESDISGLITIKR